MSARLHDGPVSGQDLRVEIHCGLLDWLQFHTTPRRIICRRHYHADLSEDARAAIDVARRYQDDGKISIITSYRKNEVLFIAERVK